MGVGHCSLPRNWNLWPKLLGAPFPVVLNFRSESVCCIRIEASPTRWRTIVAHLRMCRRPKLGEPARRVLKVVVQLHRLFGSAMHPSWRSAQQRRFAIGELVYLSYVVPVNIRPLPDLTTPRCFYSGKVPDAAWGWHPT